MTREEAIPSNEMILERARQASKDLRKRFREDLEQEPCDEYGNYKYHSDIELTEPNTATSVPCGDAISRQAVLEYLEGSEADLWHSSENELVCQYIKELSPVNPQEPKTGHWISTETKGVRYAFWCRYKCSLCGGLSDRTNFCPNCGAKMIEPQEI